MEFELFRPSFPPFLPSPLRRFHMADAAKADFHCRSHPVPMALLRINFGFPGGHSKDRSADGILIGEPPLIQMSGRDLRLSAARTKRNGQSPIVMTFGCYLEYNQENAGSFGSLSLL
jgi:hypothetical protein